MKQTIENKDMPAYLLPGQGVLVSSLLALSLWLNASTTSMAGAYLFAGESNGEDLITHPPAYSGSGGALNVRVCINPASPNAAAMEIPVQNNINVFNRLQPTTGNLVRGGANNIPSGQLDFESVALHEIGHCLGMAHVNAASESGLGGSDRDYTRATDGANNRFDLNPGADGIIGSSDDIRGDDANLHWYRRANNNPFTLANPVDSSTYALALQDLPPGHNFAANADRTVAASLGFPDTEAVMQQLTFFDEAQRSLAHDDVATLRYAASGIDEAAGTADDYAIKLEYGGISTTDCDITLGFTATTSLAFCSVGGTFIGNGHVRITSANIEFSDDYAWFFNPQTLNQPPQLQPIGNQGVTESASASIAILATDSDGDGMQLNISGLPAFASFNVNGNGSAVLNFSPVPGDAGSYPLTVEVTDSGLPALSDTETFFLTVTAASFDTDGDGLSDEFELNTLGTDPNNVDTDGDKLVDGADGVVPVTLLPGGIDTNGDGFVDGEQPLGTDPILRDTDNDGFSDGLERLYGSNPLSAGSWPNLADGDLAPLGSPDGLIDAADYLVGLRIALGKIAASPLELAHGDLYPVGAPDGVIDISDVMQLLQLIRGQP